MAESLWDASLTRLNPIQKSIRLVGLEEVYHLIQWKVLFRLNKESNFLLVDPEKYYFW